MSDGLKVILGALGGVVLILLLIGGFSDSGMGYDMMGGGLFGMLVALLFWLLLLDLLIAVMVWILDQTQHR
jgi:uncharacterized membrane protein